jgi:hypothetical protein
MQLCGVVSLLPLFHAASMHGSFPIDDIKGNLFAPMKSFVNISKLKHRTFEGHSWILEDKLQCCISWATTFE